MSFTSIEFIAFFSVVFIIYWLPFWKNKHYQNAIIAIASLFFYGYCNWRIVGLLLLTTATTFTAGLLMGKNEISDKKRWWISTASIVINLGILFVFKYYNFFINSIADTVSLFGTNLSVHSLNIILPIGISFYTFSALSYSIDVYQKKVEATTDWLSYMAYVTFFPAILSGPIGRSTKQLPQFFEKREFDYANAVRACRMILFGAFIKICIADRLGLKVDEIYGDVANQNGSTLLLYSILYTIQIYCDFAGYSMIAIGCGKLLGIELQKNFDRPYLARTVTEFWRRWHISLTTWFRDYIYFPLGGNRVSKVRWMLNTMIVFVVSGLWHGADYTFLIWGAMHGACMIVERVIYGERMKNISHKISVANLLRVVVTFSIVSFAWIFFRAENLGQAWSIITKIFCKQDIMNINLGGTMEFCISALLIIVLFAVEMMREYRPNIEIRVANEHRSVRWSFYIVLILVITFLANSAQNFIYFQF